MDYENNVRLILDESVVMCSGVCCPKKSNCYRYQLNNFFDVIARKSHHDPKFVSPSYDEQAGKCHFFVPAKTYTPNK